WSPCSSGSSSRYSATEFYELKPVDDSADVSGQQGLRGKGAPQPSSPGSSPLPHVSARQKGGLSNRPSALFSLKKRAPKGSRRTWRKRSTHACQGAPRSAPDPCRRGHHPPRLGGRCGRGRPPGRPALAWALSAP